MQKLVAIAWTSTCTATTLRLTGTHQTTRKFSGLARGASNRSPQLSTDSSNSSNTSFHALIRQDPISKLAVLGGKIRSTRFSSIGINAADSSNSSRRGNIAQMPASELKALLRDADTVAITQFIDVREPWEEQEAKLPGFTLLPLSRQAEWGPIVTQQLDPLQHTVVLCHHGVRSQMVAGFLTSSLGFEHVSNVAGGIAAYADEDSSVPRY